MEKVYRRRRQGGNKPGRWNRWEDSLGDDENHPFYCNRIFVRGGKLKRAFKPADGPTERTESLTRLWSQRDVSLQHCISCFEDRRSPFFTCYAVTPG